MTTRLSSSLTLIHKFIAPAVPLGLAMILLYITEHEFFNLDALPMLIFFSIPSVLIYIQNRNINKVEFNESQLIISDLRCKTIYDLKAVNDVKRTLLDLYKITVKTEDGNKNYKFVPSFHERMLNLFGEPKSITEFINQIKKEKAVANKPQ
jgi:hypothetical protein